MRQMQIISNVFWTVAFLLLIYLLLNVNVVWNLKQLVNRSNGMVTGYQDTVSISEYENGTAGTASISGYEDNAAVYGCPDSIAEFVAKYPEAISFAENYQEYANVVLDIDLSAEEENNGIPILIQWDKRWGYSTYGSGYLGLTGCGPTCLSMVICGLTGNTEWNPKEVAQWAEDNGYYVSGVGSSWSLMSEGAASFGLIATELELTAEEIFMELAAGHPIICSVTEGDFTTSGHFIVLSGIDGEILVNDPNSPANSSRTWSIDRLMEQIAAAWSYTCA